MCASVIVPRNVGGKGTGLVAFGVYQYPSFHRVFPRGINQFVACKQTRLRSKFFFFCFVFDDNIRRVSSARAENAKGITMKRFAVRALTYMYYS